MGEDIKATRKILQNPIIKNILQGLAVIFFGFILLNLVFLLAALFRNFFALLTKPFLPVNGNLPVWFSILWGALFLAFIFIVSWFIFRSDLGTLYKGIFMTVPIAVALFIVGIVFWQYPIISYILSGLIIIGILFYFYRAKKPWIYYFAVIFVAVALLIMNLTGADI